MLLLCVKLCIWKHQHFCFFISKIKCSVFKLSMQNAYTQPSQQQSSNVLRQCLHNRKLPKPLGDMSATKSMSTASCIVNQKHTYLSLGQPKREHTLAPLFPEPCPSSRTKKGWGYLCWWGVRRPESGSLTVYPGQGLKRISNTAGAWILWKKREAKEAQPASKQLLNSILVFSQAMHPEIWSFAKVVSFILNCPVLRAAVLVQRGRGCVGILFHCLDTFLKTWSLRRVAGHT